MRSGNGRGGDDCIKGRGVRMYRPTFRKEGTEKRNRRRNIQMSKAERNEEKVREKQRRMLKRSRRDGRRIRGERSR